MCPYGPTFTLITICLCLDLDVGRSDEEFLFPQYPPWPSVVVSRSRRFVLHLGYIYQPSRVNFRACYLHFVFSVQMSSLDDRATLPNLLSYLEERMRTKQQMINEWLKQSKLLMAASLLSTTQYSSWEIPLESICLFVSSYTASVYFV